MKPIPLADQPPLAKRLAVFNAEALAAPPERGRLSRGVAYPLVALLSVALWLAFAWGLMWLWGWMHQ